MKLFVIRFAVICGIAPGALQNESLAQSAPAATRVAAWTPGTTAPPIRGVLSDGSPIGPDPGAIFPAALANMHVLLVFWSMHDTGDIGLIGSLKDVRRTFGKGRFQIVSMCVDDDWEAWIKFMDRQGATEYGGRTVRFSNDNVWWQLIQAGSGVDCAADFHVTKTPMAFLIQPNGRFFAVNIPGEKLRGTIAKALDWDGK
ncbi:MAG TPA: hypothetical protein VFV83_03625 [Chthoniobacteraceae bacterium]|nr:hypothetical protein [Chthoniobacteraceae bacterium]